MTPFTRLGAVPTIAAGVLRRVVSRPVLVGGVAAAVDGAHFLDVPGASALVIAVNDAGPLGESVLASSLPPRWARRIRVVRDVSAGERAVEAGLAAVVIDDPVTAASVARSTHAPLVPLGITGGVAAMPPGHRLPVGGRPRVVVRAGRPLGRPDGEPEVTAATVALAVDRLLTEERLGWYGSLLSASSPAPTSAAGATGPDSPETWRRRWTATAPMDQRTRRAVWVTRGQER